MNKISTALALVFLVIGLSGRHVHAQGLKLSGLGGRVSFVDPERLDGTMGFGAYLNLGEIARKVTLQPTVEYWSKSLNSGDFSQWSFAADLRYNYSAETLHPFIGLGVGVLMSDSGIGDSSTDFGLDLLGGIEIPLSEKLRLDGELKYVLTELHSVRVGAGLTYLFGKAK